MNKCHYSQTENYWSYITKRVAAMNNNQLILLYDIHTDFLLDSELNEDNQIKRYNTFKELTYDRLVRYTLEDNYGVLSQVVDLILTGYDYSEIQEIVFAYNPF